MWKQLQAALLPSEPQQLSLESYGQEACGLPIEKISKVMKWLGQSLLAAGYEAKAHMIWDSSGADFELEEVFQGQFKRHEPVFLYRCGDRPMQPPAGHYWRLMGEHPSLRVYQLERKELS
ncbi:MAG: hypothetical protein AAF703_23220 [Cyanobacteria bacterium P01_D01_bin.105]